MERFSIRLKNVSKNYGNIKAVHEISLDIKRGEFLTLLGPSGSGKTTLLRLVGGFETPDSGEIWGEENLWTKIPPYKRPVNTVFQNYALFPHMNVVQNIAFGLKQKKMKKTAIDERVRWAVDLVGLQGREHHKPHELSGGQQQRVALARALVNEPQALLLDEPLGALDARMRRAMRIELKRLNRITGTTFIYVTHDQEEAMSMSDRVAIMRDGAIIQLGTPEEVYLKPANNFVANFVGNINVIKGSVVSGNNEYFMVKTDLCALKIPSVNFAQRPDVGANVEICVHPECISIADVKDTNNAHFIGTVKESLFIGPSVLLFIEAQNTMLRVLRPSREILTKTSVQDMPVGIVFLEMDCTVIKPEE